MELVVYDQVGPVTWTVTTPTLLTTPGNSIFME